MFLKRFKNLCEFKVYYKKHTKLMLMLFCVMLVASSAGVFISYLMSEQLIGITNAVADIAVKFTIYILIVVTIHHINWFLWSKFACMLSKKVSSNIKEDIIKSLLDTKFSIIKNKGLGFYFERINDDVNEISNFVGEVAGTLVDVFTNFSFLIIIFFFSPECGILFTIGVAVLFFMESIKVNVDLKNLKIVKIATESAESKFGEIIGGIKDIKGFGIKEEVIKKMKNTNDDLLEKTYIKNVKYDLIFKIYNLYPMDYR